MDIVTDKDEYKAINVLTEEVGSLCRLQPCPVEQGSDIASMFEANMIEEQHEFRRKRLVSHAKRIDW